MKIRNVITISIIALLIMGSLTTNKITYGADSLDKSIEMSAEVLRDKIRGGLLGQLLGNLNGLEHEMQYINEPGNVEEYTPALPEGAQTDDDTDLEWVYIVAMQRHNAIVLPPHLIVQLWRERINKRIWCSNQYARQLMDIGFEPPLTGSIVFNPWADFNISGQFICESFGLLAPGMPQTAARIGLNYTRVTIDAEPAQTTQLFTSMIATAFVTDELDNILEAGLRAIDPNCAIRQIVTDVLQWHRLYPSDWRTTRRLIKEKYSRHSGAMRDRNGYELNTASTIAALLYGEGDFVKTLMTAFNFGWDADNNAATAGTIIGVINGYRWMMKQNWKIVDRYHNTTREDMPMDETISSFADRIIDLAEKVITEQGGRRQNIDGQIVYHIHLEKPTNIVPLSNLAEQTARLQYEMKSAIETTIANESSPSKTARDENDDRKLAFAAYSAICLDLAQDLKQNYPEQWPKALKALNNCPKVVQVLFFHSPFPAGDVLRRKAIAAGLKKPERKVKIW
ncbi:MAG TPA: ADP-ribosylglycohydrolase family protein [Sedimentisphaerales bacterium]|nr:ADP-ribosylglycohydrolase family protein [Sedimentisphaerales bacterium]